MLINYAMTLVRPLFGDTLAISRGRHPIFSTKKTGFVENDVFADSTCNVQIITGPNMVSNEETTTRLTHHVPFYHV